MGDSDHRQRVLPFRNVANFRDLGGYPAADGKLVKWGTLYRSAHLAKLQDADRRRFDALGIRTVIDFRSNAERERHPDLLTDGDGLKLRVLSMLDPDTSALSVEIEDRIARNAFADFDENAGMAQMYTEIASNYTAQFAAFMEEVLTAEGEPVLWHCTSGKDRTGFAAAILLRLLGVADDVIFEDYLLSARYVDQRRGTLFMARLLRGRDTARAMRPFLVAVNADWLRLALDLVDDQWGSFDAYRRDGLGVTDADVTRLRATLLE